MPVWRVAGPTEAITSLVDLKAELLRQRGIPVEQEHNFFEPSYSEAIDNPFALVGMDRAVERLLAATKRERVLIWGDYDADGVSGTAVLLEALRLVGIEVAPYLPHRSDEGYGLNQPALERLLDTFDVLVTVDCGGSNAEEITWLVERGKDVIVVDHHELPAILPPALAILHPRHPLGHYSTTHLSGAGMAWKLSQALLRRSQADPEAEKWLLDLPLLGTLADAMPLVGENRAIVRFGLEVLRRTRRPGLRALLEAARLELFAMSARDVTFRIIPAINAAGRMDHPQAALDVLLASSADAAQKAAAYLVMLNQQRRQLTTRIMKEAQEHHDPALPLVFAFNAAWPAGVVGIVAGQLAQRFSKPAVVIGGAKQAAVGSARSFDGVDIYAALRQAESHMLKLGGHKQAAGFSLLAENIENLRHSLLDVLGQTHVSSGNDATSVAHAAIQENLLDWKLYELVRSFEPFGEGNSEPVFMSRGLVATHVRPVGKAGNHVKLHLVGPTNDIDAIGFDLHSRSIAEGQTVDVLGSLKLNSFNGSTNLQLQLVDIAQSGSVTITS